jgi:histone H3/H4
LISEIHRLQESTGFLIPKQRFQLLVREIVMDTIGLQDMKFQAEAMAALQEATEMFIVTEFQRRLKLIFIESIIYASAVSMVLAEHAQRTTILTKDMQLARKIRTEFFS